MSGVTHATRVYVVDDHPVVRHGLQSALSAEDDIVVVGHAGSGDIALCELAAMPVDVVVIDHQLASGISGHRLLESLCAPPYSLRCLVLTAAVWPSDVRALLGTGVAGVLSKSSDVAHIVTAVRNVACGQNYFDHHALQALAHRAEDLVPQESLDARDRMILGYLASGLSNREIASTMHCSPGAVKKHVSIVLRKLGVSHRTSAIAVAAARGLLHDDEQPNPASRTSSRLPTQYIAAGAAYSPLTTSR
jgi:two-component system, NarL family, response regulator DevR